MADFATEKEKLSQDFRNLLADAQGLLEATKENLDDKTKDARDRLARSLDEAKARYRGIEDRVVRELRHADEVIRERPYHTAGIAFVVGIVFGLIAGRK